MEHKTTYVHLVITAALLATLVIVAFLAKLLTIEL
jgi:hypothetical protein